MRQVIKVSTEEDLTALYGKKKTGTFNILYLSDWCTSCNRLLERVKEWKEKEGDEVVYTISSWDLPASFAMFMIMSAPSLVRIRNGRVRVDVEFPTIYRYFDVRD